jgi:hypothetical protein
VRALCEAVAELIPNGRVYILAPGPIVGSLISGVGLTRDGWLVHVGKRVQRLERF